MINHARTLLLNRGSNTYNAGIRGEEFIPPFAPVELPDYITLGRKLIFGSAPDFVFMNFRAHELLGLVHNTELAEFVYALDPRVTYTPNDGTDFFVPNNTQVLSRIGGTQNVGLNLYGIAAADNAAGRAQFEFHIRLIRDTDTTAIAQIIPLTGTTTTISQTILWNSPPLPLAFTAARPKMAQVADEQGVTPLVKIPNTLIAFQLAPEKKKSVLATEDFLPFSTERAVEPQEIAVDLPSTALGLVSAPQILAEWLLNIYVKPASVIATCLPKLEMLGEPFYLSLFGVGDSVEPYATFKNIWFDHPVPAYRLAAFVLAMVYRTEEARNANVN